MYCDDSRVTQVDAKEVVVSLPYNLSPPPKLIPLAPVGQTRLHLILQESQNVNYTLIFLPIFPSFLLLSPQHPIPYHRVVYYSTLATIQTMRNY